MRPYELAYGVSRVTTIVVMVTMTSFLCYRIVSRYREAINRLGLGKKGSKQLRRILSSFVWVIVGHVMFALGISLSYIWKSGFIPGIFLVVFGLDAEFLHLIWSTRQSIKKKRGSSDFFMNCCIPGEQVWEENVGEDEDDFDEMMVSDRDDKRDRQRREIKERKEERGERHTHIDKERHT